MKTENSAGSNRNFWWQALLVLALSLPLLLLLLLPAGTSGMTLAVVFAAVVILNLAVIWLFFRGSSADTSPATESPAPPRIIGAQEIPEAIQKVMAVRVASEDGGIRIFRGTLRENPDYVYHALKDAFGSGAVPLVQEDEQFGTAILVLPKPVEEQVLERPTRTWVNWLLLGLTFVTTTWAGALQQGVNLIQEPALFALGLPYSIALLGILGFHELGHYFTARHYKMNVTPPYFIPVPFALGTFGAFIQMRSPPEDRRSLFDVAVAGPLAGLVLAIPALFLGLQTSTVIPASLERSNEFMGGAISGSILFGIIAKASLGAKLVEDSLLQLSPLAFAGWLGLLVTALNLLPIGQLDGGHIARAMFGSRIGQVISNATMGTLFLLAIFVWPGLLFWAVIVFFLARRGAPPLNDLTPVTAGRRWLGALSFVILALILIPMPKGFF